MKIFEHETGFTREKCDAARRGDTPRKKTFVRQKIVGKNFGEDARRFTNCERKMS